MPQTDGTDEKAPCCGCWWCPSSDGGSSPYSSRPAWNGFRNGPERSQASSRQDHPLQSEPEPISFLPPYTTGERSMSCCRLRMTPIRTWPAQLLQNQALREIARRCDFGHDFVLPNSRHDILPSLRVTTSTGVQAVARTASSPSCKMRLQTTPPSSLS